MVEWLYNKCGKNSRLVLLVMRLASPAAILLAWICIRVLDSMRWEDGGLVLAFLGIFFALGALVYLIWFIYKFSSICSELDALNTAKERNMYNQLGKEGKWIFPTEKFYQQCTAQKATGLFNEYGFNKAKAIAEQLIQESCPNADMSNFQGYLTKDKLQTFLDAGKSQAALAARREAEEAKRKLEESKQVRKANADSAQLTFMARSLAISRLTGCQKRVQMLTDLLIDYNKKIQELKDKEESIRQFATVYAGTQKKESDWAILGGVANGIAGPIASAAVIWDTMKKNEEIAEYNEGIRQASMNIMSGTISVANNRIKVEQERDNVKIKLDEAKTKVSLSKPDANEIWNNLQVGEHFYVQRCASGVLQASIFVRLLRPFALDIPKNVHMVVDGTIHAYISMGDTYIGTIDFPLPLFGISCESEEKFKLDGMCGQSIEYNVGKYNIHCADKQNLWIMEA